HPLVQHHAQGRWQHRCDLRVAAAVREFPRTPGRQHVGRVLRPAGGGDKSGRHYRRAPRKRGAKSRSGTSGGSGRPPMETTPHDYLFRVEAPWIYVGTGEPERKAWIPTAFYARPGLNVCTRQLRGQKMRTTRSLMDEVGAALQFFEGFGENWHALQECLEYMDEW